MWIGENEIKDGVVKVKNMNEKTELFIPRAEMVQKVIQLVKENPVLLPQDQQPGAQQKQEEEKKQE